MSKITWNQVTAAADLKEAAIQRLRAAKAEVKAAEAAVMAANYVHELLTTVPQSSSLVSQGAESADIGKLDSADKKCVYCKHTHTFQFDEIVDDDCPVVGCPCMHFLGSAETGGEKATLAPQLCNWMMSKFNPGTGAVYCNESEGHEGQHRHTFPGCTYSTFSSATCARGSNGCDVKHKALAESSLSSPPPTKDDLSAPKSPEPTGLSIEPAEDRTAKETR